MSLPAAEIQKNQAIHPRHKFEGHINNVYGVIHLPDGQRIMTCSLDGSLRVWNMETGGQIGNDWRDGESGVDSIALSPNGKKLVSGSEDGAMKVWDMGTGKVITKWTGHRSLVTSVSWSRDGSRIMSGCFDGTVRVWDVETGKTILEINTRFSNIYTYGASYSPDETMIATGGRNSEKEFLKIWDSKTGKLIKNLKGHTDDVNCVAWTADESTLISGSHDHSITTWNTTTWQQIAILTGHTSAVFALAISPNGRILASASTDDTARLWNLENGHLVGSPLQHPDAVSCVSFSTDGKLLATGCQDKNAYAWDMSAIGNDLNELLVNDANRSILDAVATQRRNQRRENAHGIPPRFFDDSPDHPHSPVSRRPLPSSIRQDHALEPTLLGRVSSLFQHTRDHAHNTGSRLRPPGWVRNPFSGMPHRRHGEGMQLQEHRPAVVDVPFTRGKRKNVSAAEIRLEREKARNAKKKKTSSGSSRPLQINVTHHSSGALQTQPTSQLSSSSVIPATGAAFASTTLTNPRPVGRWTRFRLYICCLSGQYTDGHE